MGPMHGELDPIRGDDDDNNNKDDPKENEDRIKNSDQDDIMPANHRHHDNSNHNMNNLASVKKKRKKAQYTVSDQRDSLPFLVKVTTPDPYTNHEEMKQKARANTNMDRQRYTKDNHGLQTNKSNHKMKNVNKPMVGDSISASIYMRTTNGSLHQILGEFFLDKSTNCGDMIRVGDRDYLVQKATCQYKYVGGKRFEMVRKILEVKESVRILMEQMIQQTYDRPDESHNDFNILE
jgi:hypothetical protein